MMTDCWDSILAVDWSIVNGMPEARYIPDEANKRKPPREDERAWLFCVVAALLSYCKACQICLSSGNGLPTLFR